MAEKKEYDSGVTVGELIRELQLQPAENMVHFGSRGVLTFYRVKDRSGVTQIEFNEIETLAE